METVDSLANAVFASIKGYCDSEIDRRIEKLVASFEQRLAEVPAGKNGSNGKDGKDGENGKDADPAPIVHFVTNRMQELFDELPKPQDGKDGEHGKDGAPGKDGKDADMKVIEKRIEELVVQNVAAIPHPKDGKDGKDGEKGADGRDGESIKGDAGEKGADGINGQDGQNGQHGKDGEPGRDAFQIDVLPAIDVERSYPRGTYASYKGGRIRSLRNTDPITDGIEKAGWCIDSEGIADVAIDQNDDLRTFGIAMELTSGKTIIKSFEIPVILDRGIYKAGESYAKGDAVTWNGNFCIAQQETTQEPMAVPGASEWRIAVKRGRDGKDGKDGASGKDGPEGKRGRDLTHMDANGTKYA